MSVIRTSFSIPTSVSTPSATCDEPPDDPDPHDPDHNPVPTTTPTPPLPPPARPFTPEVPFTAPFTATFTPELPTRGAAEGWRGGLESAEPESWVEFVFVFVLLQLLELVGGWASREAVRDASGGCVGGLSGGRGKRDDSEVATTYRGGEGSAELSVNVIRTPGEGECYKVSTCLSVVWLGLTLTLTRGLSGGRGKRDEESEEATTWRGR